MSIFATVKQAVTARQVAERYGLKLNRSGMAHCLFHPDKHSSMKVDERYYCFGCGATGDAIDLAAKLFGCSPLEAAKTLAADFGITRGDTVPTSMKPAIKDKSFEETVLAYLAQLRLWKTGYAPMPTDAEWHPRFVEALQQTAKMEYLLDVLTFGEPWEQEQIKITNEKEVMELVGRIEDGRNSGEPRADGQGIYSANHP